MLPAKLARLICLLHLPLDGHHWNDDFRVCWNNVIHEFTTFFSHKQQFNDDDKSCKLEAEMLRIIANLWVLGSPPLEFFQRQFFVSWYDAAPAHHLVESTVQQWEQLIVSSVIPSAQFLFAVYISTEFRLLFFELRSNGIVKAKVQRICRVVCHKRIKTQTTLFRHLFNASIARISSPNQF